MAFAGTPDDWKESRVVNDTSTKITESLVGGRSGTSRAGFTLIELLVVLVIIGLLASIALPRFTKAREKAYQAQMQNDLRSLATAEEAYFDNYMTYTTSLSSLSVQLSAGVTISINQATGQGWSATASHSAITNQCGMYYGNATAPSGIPVPGEGVVACN